MREPTQQDALDTIENGSDEGMVIFIRATNAPIVQMSQALCIYCAKPLRYLTPTGRTAEINLPELLSASTGLEKPEPAALSRALSENPELLGLVLATISEHLPHSLIVVVDQCEEVFTLNPPKDRRLWQINLEAFRRLIHVSGNFKTILSLRTEYYGRLVHFLRTDPQDVISLREYLLSDFSKRDLIEAIQRPTTNTPIEFTNEIPRDKYGFKFAPEVVEQLATMGMILACAVRLHLRNTIQPSIKIWLEVQKRPRPPWKRPRLS